MGNHLLKKRSTDYIILNLIESNINSNTTNHHDPVELTNQLHKLILKLKGQYMITDKAVDYKSLVKNDLFQNEYLNLARNLTKVNLNKLDNDNFKKAFFINVYNSLTIHAISYLYENDSKLSKAINNGEDASVLKQLHGRFWSRFAYQIGEFSLSLDDIEHGVLRSNSPHPSSLFNLLIAGRLSTRMFRPDDPRLKLKVTVLDPRIHFALNCGAKSCPPISVYTPENLDNELDLVTRGFINSESEFDFKNKRIKLSQLLNWYKLDFCTNTDTLNENQDKQLLRFTSKYVDEDKRESLKHLIESSDFKLDYFSYNWNINVKS